MSQRISILAFAAVAAGLAGTWAAVWMRAEDPFAPCRGGQVAGGSIGGPFTLVDETGATVTDEQVLAQPALIYFGYTFCPDICPTDVQRNAFAVELLEEQGITVTPVMITIDPARDTPEVMAAFTDAFHPRLIGLTGSEEQVDAAKSAWRVLGELQAGEDPEDPFRLMTHTTFSYLTLPGLGFVEFFGSDVSPEEVATATACFIARV